MNIFLNLDRETWTHRLDPRTKILATLMLFSLCLCFNHPAYLAAVTLGILVIAVLSRALPNFWKLRFLLTLLFVFSAVMWPLFASGPTPLWNWGPFTVSRESLLYGIAMGLRLSSFVMAGLILLSTTRNEEMGDEMCNGDPFIVFAAIMVIKGVSCFRPDFPWEFLTQDGRGSHDKSEHRNHTSDQGGVHHLSLACLFACIEGGRHSPGAHQSADLIPDPGQDLSRGSPALSAGHHHSGAAQLYRGHH